MKITAVITCRFCNQEVKPVAFQMGGIDKIYQPPVCNCQEAQVDLEKRIQKNEMTNWRSKAIEIIKRAGLDNPAYTDKRFNNWDITRHSGAAESTLAIVESYVNNVSLKSENWALFTGPYGTGKTHLAIAALRKIAAQNLWRPHVIIWPEICVRTRENWGNKKGRDFEAGAWDKARQVQVLLIDDLDKTKTDENSMEKLFTVINARYERKAPTIITMNRSLSDLDKLWTGSKQQHLKDTGKAVLSRIYGQLMIEIEFHGSDQRLE